MTKTKTLSGPTVDKIIGELEMLIEDNVYYDHAEQRIGGIGVLSNEFRAFLTSLKLEGLHDGFNRRREAK